MHSFDLFEYSYDGKRNEMKTIESGLHTYKYIFFHISYTQLYYLRKRIIAIYEIKWWWNEKILWIDMINMQRELNCILIAMQSSK